MTNSSPEPTGRPKAVDLHLDSLRSYLADQQAPIQVASAVQWLLRHDPGSAGQEILSWSRQQVDAAEVPLPLRVFLFHCLRKLATLVELGALDAKVFRPRIDELAHTLLGFCPVEQRGELRERIDALWTTDQSVAKTVDLLHGGALQRSAAGSEPTRGLIDEELVAEPLPEPWQGPARDARRESGKGSAAGAAVRNISPDAQELGAADSSAPAPGTDAPGEADAVASHPVGAESRVVSSAPSSRAEPLDPRTVQNLQRLSLLIERLEGGLQQAGGEAGADERGREAEMAGGATLVAAINASPSHRDFRRQLDGVSDPELQGLAFDQLIRRLSDALPDWSVASGDLQKVDSPTFNAVRGAVRLQTGAQGSQKAHQLVHQVLRQAVDNVNDGALGRAVTVLTLGEQMMMDVGLNLDQRHEMLRRAGAALNHQVVLALGREHQNHVQLRSILKTFPQTQIDSLYDRLEASKDRRERHQLLQLLQIYGSEARSRAVQIVLEAAAPMGQATSWYVVRNMLLILRRVEPDEDGPSDAELEAVVQLADLEQAPGIYQEVLLYLGQVPRERAGDALARCLLELMRAGLKRDLDEAELGTIARLQVLTLRQLLRRPEDSSQIVALDFLLKESRWQESYSSLLREYGQRPLADSPRSVGMLVEAIGQYATRRPISSRILARLRVDNSDDRLEAMVRALRRTPLPQVDRVLESVQGTAMRPSTARFINSTREALREAILRPPAPPKLEGDLEIFGLPSLLQLLEEQRASGVLELTSHENRDWARMRLHEGALVDARFGKRTGLNALYQLLQHPFSSRFEFSAETASRAPLREPVPITALLLESLRRADELRQMRAATPGSVRLAPGDQKPTAPENEEDGQLLRQLWVLVRQQASFDTCEGQAEADAWRVRRILFHWQNTGAVRFVQTAGLLLAIGA